jgi:phage terminase large subunit
MKKEQILKIKSSLVLEKSANAGTRVVVNQGGTSSGKTWSILQLLIVLALQKKLQISICAATMPHLKRGALRDFISILSEYGLYDEKYYNKTDHIFRLAQSQVEFFSLDEPGKARGPRRDILFVNEANLVPFETFNQLMLRTRQTVFVDYNPVDENHWIYEKILNRNDCTFIKSTYLDNGFLDENIVKEIERLKDTDENYWKVYGLGERGQLKSTIYSAWEIVDALPEGGDVFYGLDFGYNVPTALVKCCIKDGILLWVDELIYESHITNSDLIELMRTFDIKRSPIYADAADPQRINEIQRSGFNCKPADKSVKNGIDRLKRSKVHVTRRSANILKERQGYKWKEDNAGLLMDEPIKCNDHALDAIRYAVHTHALKPSGKYAIL